MPVFLRAALIAVCCAFLSAASPFAAAAIPADLAAEFDRIAASYPEITTALSQPQPAEAGANDPAGMAEHTARRGAENKWLPRSSAPSRRSSP